MNFQDAFAKLQAGHKIRRTDWGYSKDTWIFLGVWMGNPCISFKTETDGSIINNSMAQFFYFDIISNDWVTDEHI